MCVADSSQSDIRQCVESELSTDHSVEPLRHPHSQRYDRNHQVAAAPTPVALVLSDGAADGGGGAHRVVELLSLCRLRGRRRRADGAASGAVLAQAGCAASAGHSSNRLGRRRSKS